MSDATCPCCGETDAVERVGSVIDLGTQNTGGAALTFGGIGAGGFRVDPSVFLSRTQTNLAARLSPDTLTPGNITPGMFCGALVFGTLIVAYTLKRLIYPSFGEPIYSWIFSMLALCLPGVLICLVLMMVGFSIYRFSRPTARAEWFVKQDHLYRSWYCFRDDVVFDEDFYGTPEDFKAYLFQNRSNI